MNRPHRLGVSLAVGFSIAVRLGLATFLESDARAEDPPDPSTVPATSYAGEIAAILDAKCVACHRPGEIASMPLTTYEEVRPWAKSIRATVMLRRMPPWGADRAHGTWSNDISLSDDEIGRIVRWVDGGAPQGNPADRPPPPVFPSGWTIGEPDAVVELPPFSVPPDGPDLYPNHVVTVDVPEGAWLSAVEVLPGERRLLHHAVVYLGDAAMGGDPSSPLARKDAGTPRFGTPGITMAAICAAGTPATVYPEGTGHPLAPRQTMTFNMHYHPDGRASVDRTRVGFRFGRGPLAKRMRTVQGVNAGIRIPPGAADHEERAVFHFDHDSRIVSLIPHMHQIGRRFAYVLRRPDGTSETLLNVPAFDFEWQWIYRPKEPIHAPAGSIVEIVGAWNNARPRARSVGFGEGTGDEMLIGFMDLIPERGDAFPTTSDSQSLTAFLERLGVAETFLLRFPAMPDTTSGVVLPRGGADGGFYVRTGDALLYAPVRDLEWNGRTAVGNLDLFGQGMGLKGSIRDDEGIDLSISTPEGLLLASGERPGSRPTRPASRGRGRDLRR